MTDTIQVILVDPAPSQRVVIDFRGPPGARGPAGQAMTGELTASAACAGPFVNVWDDAGSPRMRNADAAVGYAAHGWIAAPVAQGDTALVEFGGSLTVDLPPGPAWLSDATPGGVMSDPPIDGSGHFAQDLGVVIDGAGTLVFKYTPPAGPL